jgi:DNA-binding response OmpR family regulator
MIDDDRSLTRLIRDYLTPLGYGVEVASDGVTGLEMAKQSSWHAIILDVMLPGMDGFEVLKGIRKVTNTPVLMLTGRADETDRIVGLEVGADDYLPKTFSMRELLARLRAVTRRNAAPKVAANAVASDAPEIRVGDLSIQPACRTAFIAGRQLQLRHLEFEILLALAQAKGRVRTRDWLLENIRDREYEVFDRSIDMHISALRRKLGDDPKRPRYIRTCRSAGYMLMDPIQERAFDMRGA